MSTDTPHPRPLLPFLLMGLSIALIGFITTVNGQLQGPLKLSFLSLAPAYHNTYATLISFFFFLGFLFNGRRGGRWVNEHGYQSTMLRSFGFMLAGLLCYAISAIQPLYYFSLGTDALPYPFLVFLLGAFLLGCSSALFIVVVNPYVAAYNVGRTSSIQRLNIASALNSLGTTVAPFFVSGVIFAGVAMEDIKAEQIFWPVIIIMIAVIFFALMIAKSKIPDLPETRNVGDEGGEVNLWSFKHFKWGVVSIFIYVGVEVAVGVNISLHAMSQLGDSEGISVAGLAFSLPAFLATLYWGGMMLGRIFSSMMSKVTARTLLLVSSFFSCVLVIVAASLHNLYLLAAVGLFHSVMWGAIFSLATEGLGKHRSKAAGIVITGIFGGAVIPLLQGGMADLLSWQNSWYLIAACEACLLLYALSNKKRPSTI